MLANYTVIFSVRQGFGNEPDYLSRIEPAVPFVGPSKEYTFSCLKVDPKEEAVLMFQSRDVNSTKNVITINGKEVFGGIPVSPSKDTWNGNIMLFLGDSDSSKLKESGNVLRIEARNSNGGNTGNIDDFILDNMVVMYKTL